MTKPYKRSPNVQVGELVKKMRRKKGLSRQALAGHEFTKSYIDAVEKGTVVPSRKVLEVLSVKLEQPVELFLSSRRQLSAELNVEALQEDIIYQINYVKMLVRAGNVADAGPFLDVVEKNTRPYWDMLPGSIIYLFPYMRARLHFQVLAPKKALPYLEEALLLAVGSPRAEAQVNNLLGAVYFELNQAWKALRCHQLCEQCIIAREVKDQTFILNVYRNLANDYWATNQPELALGVYRDLLLPLIQNLCAPEEHARIFWGMAMVYTNMHDTVRGIGSAVRALDIYISNNTHLSEAADVCLYLAELYIRSSRYEEAVQALERVEKLLAGTVQLITLSYMEKWYADIAFRHGRYKEASVRATRAVELAREQYERSIAEQNEETNLTWQNPNQPYAEALHMQALIEEKIGNIETSSELFERALELLEPHDFAEAAHKISYSYAEKLESWRDFRKATQYYKAAAELQYSARRNAS